MSAPTADFEVEFLRRSGGHPNDFTDNQLESEESLVREAGDLAFADKIRSFRDQRGVISTIETEFYLRTDRHLADCSYEEIIDEAMKMHAEMGVLQKRSHALLEYAADLYARSAR